MMTKSVSTFCTCNPCIHSRASHVIIVYAVFVENSLHFLELQQVLNIDNGAVTYNDAYMHNAIDMQLFIVSSVW